MYPRLPAAQGQGRAGQFLQLHGHQGHGHLLTAGQQHIFFPGRRVVCDLSCLFQQLVGGISLRRYHHRHLMALLSLLGNQLSRPLDMSSGGQR